MNTSFLRMILITTAFITSLSGCSSVTDSIAASTQTFTNSTESSSRVSSSNNSSSAAANQIEQAIEFAEINWMQLSSNMAQGQGEHLTAMAEILHISTAQKPAFYQMTKNKFSQLFSSTETTAEQLVQRLSIEITALQKV